MSSYHSCASALQKRRTTAKPGGPKAKAKKSVSAEDAAPARSSAKTPARRPDHVPLSPQDTEEEEDDDDDEDEDEDDDDEQEKASSEADSSSDDDDDDDNDDDDDDDVSVALELGSIKSPWDCTKLQKKNLAKKTR